MIETPRKVVVAERNAELDVVPKEQVEEEESDYDSDSESDSDSEDEEIPGYFEDYERPEARRFKGRFKPSGDSRRNGGGNNRSFKNKRGKNGKDY